MEAATRLDRRDDLGRASLAPPSETAAAAAARRRRGRAGVSGAGVASSAEDSGLRSELRAQVAAVQLLQSELQAAHAERAELLSDVRHFEARAVGAVRAAAETREVREEQAAAAQALQGSRRGIAALLCTPWST